MINGILIVFFSIILLIVIHELGHFLMAKKFNAKVEEFGIGIPPKIISKKIGETVYSLNLLPIGAFVKILGEDEKVNDPRSFSEKTIWQRFLILVAGVVSFWVVAFLLLTVMARMGMPTAIPDDATGYENPKVQVLVVQKNSPAEEASLRMGDTILQIQGSSVDQVSEIQETFQEYAGQEVLLLIERQGEQIEKLVTLNQQGLLGVQIERVGIEEYSWWQAPVQGLLVTGRLTSRIVFSLGDAAYRLVARKPMPEEMEVVGPVGIGVLAFEFLEKGLFDYLWLMVLISISLAIFNLLPIPALDGGRILFLLIEKIKGKPINPETEKKLIAASFGVLLLIFAVVTLRDILNLEVISNLL